MSAAAVTAEDVDRLRERIAAGGVVLFGADTVYGLGCDPENDVAVAGLYALKGRPPEQPAAVMLFALDHALELLPELGPREGAAMRALLPGPVTLLLPNRERRFPLACGPEPRTLGLRVPRLSERLTALARLQRPLLQTSANLSGEPPVRKLSDVAPSLRAGVALALDAGELPGAASTVLDLREYEHQARWRVVREGPLGREELQRALGSC